MLLHSWATLGFGRAVIEGVVDESAAVMRPSPPASNARKRAGEQSRGTVLPCPPPLDPYVAADESHGAVGSAGCGRCPVFRASCPIQQLNSATLGARQR